MVEPTAEQQFAEDMGHTFEQWSLPRMAGRVWGLLLVADDDPMSAQDLSDRLHASAGSISAATRFLLQARLIERVRQPGERREYFRFVATAPEALFQQRIDGVARMHRTVESAIPRFADREGARDRLDQLHDFYDWLEGGLRDLMGQWKSNRPGNPPDD